MLRFVFTDAEPLAGPSAGLGLSDLTVSGNRGSASTRMRVPNNSMMVAPSVADLLLTAVELLAPHARNRRVVFDATASSFSLTFRHSARGVSITSGGGVEIDYGSVDAFIAAVRRDVLTYAQSLRAALPECDPEVSEVVEAVRLFDSLGE